MEAKMNESVNTDSVKSVGAQILLKNLTESESSEKSQRSQTDQTTAGKSDSIAIVSKNIRQSTENDSNRTIDKKIHNFQVSLNKVNELVSKLKADSEKAQSQEQSSSENSDSQIFAMAIDIYSHSIKTIISETRQNELAELKKYEAELQKSDSSTSTTSGIDSALTKIETKFSESIDEIKSGNSTGKIDEVSGSVTDLKKQVENMNSDFNSANKLGQLKNTTGIGSEDYIRTSVGADIQVMSTLASIMGNTANAGLVHNKLKSLSYLKLVNT
jgi:hypothetical protein